MRGDILRNNSIKSKLSLFKILHFNSILVSGYWHTDSVNCLGYRVKQRLDRLALVWVTILATSRSVSFGMGYRISMSISADSLLDET